MKLKNYFYPTDYYDKNGHHIYYSAKDDLGYRIEEKDERVYSILRTRLLIGTASTVMFTGLFKTKYSIMIGLVVLILLELYFKQKFLPSLKISTSFNVVDENKPLVGQNRSKMILSVFLISLFAIVFFIFALQEREQSLYIVSAIVGLLSSVELVKRIFLLKIKD